MQLIDQFFQSQEQQIQRRPFRPQVTSTRVGSAAVVADPEEAEAEREWRSEERSRIDAYAAKQFAQIKQQREEIAAWRGQVERTLVAREQEVNRQLKLIAVRNRKLQQREAEWAELSERLTRTQGELEEARAQLEQAAQQLQTQRQSVADLLAQEAVTVAAVREAEARRAQIEAAVAEQRLAAAAEQQELAFRREQLDRRFEGLERGEHDLARRSVEAAEVETRVRQELDFREKEFDRQRQERLAREDRVLRSLRAKVVVLSRELETCRRQQAARACAELANMRAKVIFLSRELEAWRGKKSK
jgi:hypothetical protein